MYNYDTYYMIQFLAVPKATDDRDEVQTCFDKTKKGKERKKKQNRNAKMAANRPTLDGRRRFQSDARPLLLNVDDSPDLL